MKLKTLGILSCLLGVTTIGLGIHWVWYGLNRINFETEATRAYQSHILLAMKISAITFCIVSIFLLIKATFGKRNV